MTVAGNFVRFVIFAAFFCSIGAWRVCAGEPDKFRLVFYNVENLFDTTDDPDFADEEFTPRGSKNWTRERYRLKLRKIAEALAMCADECGLPAFVALAEVENGRVLRDLVSKTELADAAYSAVHIESADVRGIDVALLYDRRRFELLDESFYRPDFATRDIAYAKGVMDKADTLHLFVCHFPSMRGGEKESDWRRVAVAGMLREKVDSLFSVNPGANILICGDMNGVAGSAGMTRLKASDPKSALLPENLYDLAWPWLGRKNSGSYCYMGVWQTIDHIIVSTALMSGESGFLLSDKGQVILDNRKLLEENKKGFGWQPCPTYRGRYYKGGYSDHLPVFADFSRN